ncbi:MAG TPA: BTAD domain-containing putative transcriptional regulator, partial [Pseudonocardia sp.]|nr:BTAD domain-containing putative transcriptional regulator [Pseudonocardia sp.]
MHIHVLGDLEVVVDGQQVDLGGAKPRTLVGLLVAAGGRAVAVEQLIEEIWDGAPPARVEASLQTYVARLRRALGTGRTDRIRTHAGGYSLRQDDAEVDARLFAAEVAAARAEADPRAAVVALTAALARWRGEAYAGLPSAGLRAEAVRLGELRMAATEDLWQLRTDLGDHAEAVGTLERLVAEHPLRERLWALLARAQYLAARQGDALATLRRAREHLSEELGVDPGPELQALEQAILRQDPALAPARPAPAPTVPPATPPAADAPGIFGRDTALATAEELLAAVASTGRGRVLVVEGESGIGKSRLADEVAERARRRGLH